MTPEQIDLVKSTWERVWPERDQAAALFYGKLFELDPDTRHLFKTDMEEQGRKLMAMLGMAVNGARSAKRDHRCGSRPGSPPRRVRSNARAL